MGGMELQGISRAGPTVLARTSLLALWFCGGQVQKRHNGLYPPFCLRESCPPAPMLMPDTSVLPCMPLVPFKLLSWCQNSEGESLNKSVYGFFKGNCLGLLKFLPPTQSPLVFAARIYKDLFSWHWNLGLGGLVWDSSLLRYPSQIFITIHGSGTSPFCVSAPLTSLDGCGFFHSIVVRFPFNLISDCFKWIVLHSGIVLMWFCE